jgi:hypothetical protein
MELSTIMDQILAWIPRVLTIVGAFAAVATVTPNKVDDKILQFIMDLVNFLGLNLGKAKTKD